MKRILLFIAFILPLGLFAQTTFNYADAGGQFLTLHFSGTALNTSFIPATTSFNVTKSGTQVGVNAVIISSTQVTLSLSSTIANGASDVVVSYTAPGTNFLRNTSGSAVDNITDQYVITGFPTYDVSDLILNLSGSNLTFYKADGTSDGTLKNTTHPIGVFTNVATVNGQVIDIVAKTINSGTTWSSYDNSSSYSDAAFEFQISNGVDGYTQMEFDFIQGGSFYPSAQSGKPVMLQNVYVNTYDIDYMSPGY